MFRAHALQEAKGENVPGLNDSSAPLLVRSKSYLTCHYGARLLSHALGAHDCNGLDVASRYGRAVVEAALGRLQDHDLEGQGVTHFLFETAIPAFYEKLGARQLAKDLVINSTGDGVAFEDDFVMVFPESRPWPKGTIDLRGPGY